MGAGLARVLYRFVTALELCTLTLHALGLLARQPAHTTELPDPGLTERLSLHGRGGLAHGSPSSRSDSPETQGGFAGKITATGSPILKPRGLT